MSKHETELESGETAAFRAEVRAWIAANKPVPPPFKLPQSFLEVESDQQFEYLRDFQRKVYDAGYLGFDVPAEYGGRGVDPEKYRVVAQELARARAPFFVNFIGIYWAGPTILRHGTEEQKKRLLPPLLRGDEIWCQGFSEPEYGSDLAGLQARAVKTANGGYAVTGHKVWTTLAHVSKWMILLARTDPAAHKYAGLSFFLFPMDVPGITVQPLVKMTGEGGFNQVIFDAAEGPPSALLGQEGQGWEIAMTTLLFERGASEGTGRERATAFLEGLKRVVDLAKRARSSPGGSGHPSSERTDSVAEGGTAAEHAVLDDRLAQLYIEAQAQGLNAYRSGVPGLVAERPFALRFMTKLVASEWNQRLTELACEMLGPDAAYWLGDEHAPDRAEWPRAFLSSFGMTIGGGTSEIQRNILGERILNLPKSK
jgi:alkylation response protein AidB-like acyl-CoA dehydrogenase